MAIVTLAWLLAVPTETTTGTAAPALTPAGTVALICKTPGTELKGACGVPIRVALMPSMVTPTGIFGVTIPVIRLASVAVRLHLLAPEPSAQLVAPNPVTYMAMADPLVAGVVLVLTVISPGVALVLRVAA